MAGILKGVIDKLATKPAPRRDPRVVVALAGKHPSFDDHFEWYGPGAGRLPAAMQVLYSEGIKRNPRHRRLEQARPRQAAPAVRPRIPLARARE